VTRVFRVLGPPGTGKTTYLARQAELATEKHGVHAVAVCSLTNTAAKNIAARTRLPDRNVATLHSHCLQSLGRPALAEGPDAIRQFSEQHPAHRRTHRVATGEPGSGGTSADRHHEHAGALRAAMTPIDQWPPAVRNYHQTWTAWKQREGVMDFTDLIAETATTGLHGGHRVLLVDEAQDLSRMELEVIRATAGRMDTTVLAGDGAQALFAFRGADPTALTNLTVDGERVLETSWRCGQTIIDRARHLLRRNQPVLDVDYHAREGHTGQVLRSRGSIHDPAATVHDIRRALEHGTVMVVATCAHMLTPLCSELRDAGLPFHNPYRPDQPAWNPMRQARPLLALLSDDPRTVGDAASPLTWAGLADLTEPLVKRALDKDGWDLVAYRTKKDRFGQTQGNDPIPRDTLADILPGGHSHPMLAGPAQRVDWWATHLKRPKAAQLPLKVWRQEPAKLAQSPQVIVGTAHSVKGGEADTTIVLPDSSRSAWWVGDRGAVTRALYVAMTRARHTLLLGRPSTVEAMSL
jgi:superfamily I DNA/RNA helicase